jgi:hypothetical protein
MNEILEQLEFKLFQPMALRTNIVPKYITVDTLILIRLFGEHGTKQKLSEAVNENKYPVWNEIFNLDLKVFKKKHYDFAYMIQTDGIGTSLLFIHRNSPKIAKGRKKVSEPALDLDEFTNVQNLTTEQINELKKRKVVGVDPGKFNLIYMATEHGKGNKEKLRYTCSQRRVESLAQRNSRILEKERKQHNIIEEETKFSTNNSKTINYEKFKEYIKEKNILNARVSGFHNKPTWRKMKFRTQSYTQKSEAKLLTNIEKTFGKSDDIVLAYGDWQEKKQMKHFMSTPGIGLRRKIAKNFLTITVNEYKTSKVCCKCHGEIEKMVIRGKSRFRLLKCKECVSCKSEKSVLFTRDLNSALNIGYIFRQWLEKGERPEEYKRKIKSF